ncbi:hypothetical protein Tco_1030582 [Tanacetum coccineum]|uniref:Uncharacterized protein n=1 Tax=Tanacetum coccineum TaxID=301880 RepID=A0ABQ5G6M2_9ASTR
MVTIPPSTGNFSIPWAVDGTARIADIPGLPIMPLYGDGDLITIKFIQAVVECSLLPTITDSSSINVLAWDCLTRCIYLLMESGSTTALAALNGKEMPLPCENFWLTFCLVFHCHDCTI